MKRWLHHVAWTIRRSSSRSATVASRRVGRRRQLRSSGWAWPCLCSHILPDGDTFVSGFGTLRWTLHRPGRDGRRNGFAPRDVTPEATRSVVERFTPDWMRQCSRVAPVFPSCHAFPRSASGIRGRTLILNLPGSVRARKRARRGAAALPTVWRRCAISVAGEPFREVSSCLTRSCLRCLRLWLGKDDAAGEDPARFRRGFVSPWSMTSWHRPRLSNKDSDRLLLTGTMLSCTGPAVTRETPSGRLVAGLEIDRIADRYDLIREGFNAPCRKAWLLGRGRCHRRIWAPLLPWAADRDSVLENVLCGLSPNDRGRPRVRLRLDRRPQRGWDQSICFQTPAGRDLVAGPSMRWRLAVRKSCCWPRICRRTFAICCIFRTRLALRARPAS